jgi:uncharacterized protein YoxC
VELKQHIDDSVSGLTSLIEDFRNSHDISLKDVNKAMVQLKGKMRSNQSELDQLKGMFKQLMDEVSGKKKRRLQRIWEEMKDAVGCLLEHRGEFHLDSNDHEVE